MKERKRENLGVFALDEVLPLIGVRTEEGNFKHSFLSPVTKQLHTMKLGKSRLVLFKNNQRCVRCGRLGAYFKMERDLGHTEPHFNLYSKDHVMLTKDHIIPKSKGGVDKLHNYQTMCEICNSKKGNKSEE